MKRCEVSIVLYDDQGRASRDLRVDLNSVDDGKHQPVVTMRDRASGASTVTKLPISDYSSLLGKLNAKISNLDSQSAQGLISKVITAINFFG